MRSANLDVQRERRVDRQTYFVRLIEFVSAGHDDEDVDVAVGVGFAVGVGAEEDDPVGMELLGDAASEFLNFV